MYEEIDIRKPGRGEVRVRNRAIGVNYTDVYLRKGTFPPPEMPFTLGKEGAGEVVAIGDDVTDFAIGDRVAYVETLGAYA
ncbi:alcohol dehydrogenase catalytic domain-containing protein, partial [Burkholderia sp. SIMBA_019]|uniref:alcohol dehydrogenase catalytic domain-containing protein n=1 Tax=Burkholderia sp. SIMBA_019 TaxID=3085765 RepID=UPI0039797D85